MDDYFCADGTKPMTYSPDRDDLADKDRERYSLEVDKNELALKCAGLG